MTRHEAIEFGEDRADLFGGKMEEFIKLSVDIMKKVENGELINRKEVKDAMYGLCDTVNDEYADNPYIDVIIQAIDNL